jgi:hypothetical protein
MNLWIVIMIAGKLAETVGPVPYGMDRCQELVSDKAADIDALYRKPGFAADLSRAGDGSPVPRSAVTIKCEYAAERPTR